MGSSSERELELQRRAHELSLGLPVGSLDGISGDMMEDLDSWIGVAGRPDGAGNWSGAYRPETERASNFPYDEDDPDSTYGGTQTGHDRGNAQKPAGHFSTLTPKDTSHSVWDDMDEAMGTPIFFAKSDSSNMGGIAPGINGSGWANKPMKPWDENEDLDEVELTTYQVSDGETFDPYAPETERTPDQSPEYEGDMSDSEIDFVIDKLFGTQSPEDEFSSGSPFPSDITVFVQSAASSFSSGLGNALKPSRGMAGMPREGASVWGWIEEMLKRNP